MNQNQFTEREVRDAIRVVLADPRMSAPHCSFGSTCAKIGDSAASLAYQFSRYRTLRGAEKRQSEGWQIILRVESRYGVSIVAVPLSLSDAGATYSDIAESIESFLPIGAAEPEGRFLATAIALAEAGDPKPWMIDQWRKAKAEIPA